MIPGLSRFLLMASAIALTTASTAAPWALAEGTANAAAGATQPAKIKEWFDKYDNIRHSAQMTPAEKQRADAMMSKGLSLIVPGEEKQETQNLLNSLVARDGKAADTLKQLPVYPETKQLHLGYYKYFIDAKALFSDYVTVQNNVFAQNNNGKALATDLMPRKQALEQLDQTNKGMDAQLRKEFDIAPYKW